MFSVLITTFSLALSYTNPTRVALASALRRLSCDIAIFEPVILTAVYCHRQI